MDIIFLRAGSAAARLLIKNWLRAGAPHGGRNMTFGQLIEARLPNHIQQRRLERQIEQVAEEITERLSRFRAIEFPTVDDQRLKPVATVLEDVMRAALDEMSVVLEADLTASQLAKLLESKYASLIRSARLNRDQLGYLKSTLAEAANYLVEAWLTMPTSQDALLVEMLQRETQLRDYFTTVMRNLPSALAVYGADEQKLRDRDFETEYRRAVARKLDFLNLYGVNLSEWNRKYALDVAYISLNAEETRGRRVPLWSGEGFDFEQSRRDSALSFRRVDELISPDSVCTLIRGDAGSGKTTLLQWLAVNCARGTLPGKLSSWNEQVPIFVQLRTYLEDMPSPEDFVRSSVPHLASAEPDAWSYRLLRSGRVLLLLDGIDEMPSESRDLVNEWLRSIRREFPNSKILMTSRHAAVSGTEIEHVAWQVFDLQPMTPTDAKALVDHWHEAVSLGETDEAELQHIAQDREQLKRLIDDRRSIRNLATNPLMCALICALNRERGTELPNDRVELYEISLAMLLERRDTARRVYQEKAIRELGIRRVKSTLQDLAYWFVRNGLSEADKEAVLARISQHLNYLSSEIEPGLLLEHLVVRTGLMREPRDGRVDFVHRTFLEYLAAREVVEKDDIKYLLLSADQYQLREVIALAAGLANNAQRNRLIRGLLRRAEQAEESDFSLDVSVIALNCMEVSAGLGRNLRRELGSLASRLIPPRSERMAEALSAAGEFATARLSGHQHRTEREVACCIRAASLIGGAAAMEVIRSYSEDGRPKVVGELSRAWSYFPEREYVQNVLASAPLRSGTFPLAEPSHAQYLPMLKHLTGLVSDAVIQGQYLETIGAVQSIRRLDLGNVTAADFRWLRLENLKRLAIAGRVDSTVGLERLPALTSVSITGRTFDLDALCYVDRLKRLRLSSTELLTLRQLLARDGSLRYSLESLDLTNATSLNNLIGISEFKSIHTLIVDDTFLVDLQPIAGMSSIRRLSLKGSPFQDLGPLATLPNLTWLNLDYSAADDFSALAAPPNLQRVSAKGVGSEKLAFLAERGTRVMK